MLAALWRKLFLEERPSIGLSLFRPFAAFTVAAHILPTFVRLDDNYLPTAFKEKNFSFFTPNILQWVEQSPDALVKTMVVVLCLSVFLFGIGLFSRVSCIAMTLCCYYFYALNSLHIGTLSYDILLVTLFLLCVTPYPGDSLSVDCRLRTDSWTATRVRPIFVQRLLQMQVSSTFFYTALCKVSASGNWLTDNPIFYLLNSTSESVVKQFPFRHFFAARPELCFWIGVGIICFEFSLSVLIWWKKTRDLYIFAGFLFHVMLVVTLHVPTIFFFLFPPQLFLFVEPEKVEGFFRKFRRTRRL